MNLLSNAIDAIEEASLGKKFEEIERSSNIITVTTQLSTDKDSVLVSIRDNGIGMTEATKQRVFENLLTTKAVGQGTGLCLAIVHQIIAEKHGGTIEVNSNLGEGAEFIIRLPLESVLEHDLLINGLVARMLSV